MKVRVARKIVKKFLEDFETPLTMSVMKSQFLDACRAFQTIKKHGGKKKLVIRTPNRRNRVGEQH